MRWAGNGLILAVLVLTVAPLQARPAHKKALADHLGSLLPKKLNDCRTCHLPDPSGKTLQPDEDRPHNPFGARLKAVRTELRQAGKPVDLISRLQAIANEDSDGDGASNLVELLTGHNPGETEDRPDAQQLAAAPQLVQAYRAALTGYPWRPFERVVRPPIPKIKNTSWVRNPIDAFIAAEHEKLGLKPRPEAPREVLLRRIYIDLIGLPPTREELLAALNDWSSDWYEKVVERLLADPRYGERWGRHWMDVWRYSDWTGFGAQIRDSQPHIWRWRDWIIESLNEDKGYNQMILEMLAADELYPEDPQRLRATGYLVRNYKLFSREKWLQDTVEHTAMAFLGITLGCAKCHDHMYDPIGQREYYQMRAIFEPHHVRTDKLPASIDPKGMLVRAYDANLTAPTYFFIRGDDRTPDKSKVMMPGVPEALGGHFPKIEPVNLPPTAWNPEKLPWMIQEAIDTSQQVVAKAAAKVQPLRQRFLQKVLLPRSDRPLSLEAHLSKLATEMEILLLAATELELAEAQHQALLAVLKVEKLEDAGKKNTAEWQEAARTTVEYQRQVALVQARLNLFKSQQTLASLPAKETAKRLAATKAVAAAQQALEKAERAAKMPLTTAYTPRPIKAYPSTSTGRRSALARWLADRDNPLTARVAVNHIWLRHFGQAIVPTTFDFGRNGRPPSHPALLDWLAAELMEPSPELAARPAQRDTSRSTVFPAKPAPWSMKHLHRLIVTSSTYRLHSTPEEANAAIDRDNRYLWRIVPRRVEAEVVRDALFYVAGKLDLTRGGPEIPHQQGLTVPRRSLYFQRAAERSMEFLDLFDGPSTTECYERKQAIVPQQALALTNSELARTHSKLLAHNLHLKAGTDNALFITMAFEQVLTRRPIAAELSECQAFLQQLTLRYSQNKKTAAEAILRAREHLTHVLLNHHEFVTIR